MFISFIFNLDEFLKYISHMSSKQSFFSVARSRLFPNLGIGVPNVMFLDRGQSLSNAPTAPKQRYLGFTKIGGDSSPLCAWFDIGIASPRNITVTIDNSFCPSIYLVR